MFFHQKFKTIFLFRDYDKFDDPFCNMFNGSEGSMYGPYLQEGETLYVMVPELCR